MTPERWHRIEALFDDALARPTAERAAVLAAACPDDPELAREVHALLAATPGAADQLRGAIAAEADRLVGDAGAAQVGGKIGPYRIRQLIGEGGMGTVYLAERDDAEFRQRVAIKLLTHGFRTAEAIARFRDERQILAGLDHPHIVRLLDGGRSAEGVPYLVMEHIEGTTLTRYASAHALSVHARLGLIRQVCAALQYAHQNLVVHRDIKPSNILVDREGALKVLDFGIAKLVAPSGAVAREARTRTGSAMFTPEYASPEQARGDAVSTATDVYSVGAVLYELMTGRPPHAGTGDGLESLRVICDVDPVRPSVAAPAPRRRELAGDLDNIILKALHKEPARRYASMEQLADDLGRFLEGRPIHARTATLGYQVRKFVRRNKVAVAAAGLVALALVGGTGVSLWQARRADEQAARAQLEKRNALDAAERARLEADRARKAEAQVQAQLDQIRAEQVARARAEAEARAKGSEAELSREQLRVALAHAQQETRVAEQESARAHEAELHSQAAAQAEKQAREDKEALYQRERARRLQLEEQSKKITSVLR